MIKMNKAASLVTIAGLLAILSGGIILVFTSTMGDFGGLLGALFKFTAVGVSITHILTGAFLIIASTRMEKSSYWSFSGLFISIVAIFAGAGFFIGPVIGILGSFRVLMEHAAMTGRRVTRSIVSPNRNVINLRRTKSRSRRRR